MEIKVYTSNNCVYCYMLKDYFKEEAISYTEVEVNEKKEYFQEFKSLGGIGTPFIVKLIDGEVIAKVNGFNKEKISKEILS